MGKQILVLIIGVAIGILIVKGLNFSNDQSNLLSRLKPTPTTMQSCNEPSDYGGIEGPLGFPTDTGIPEEIIVCAETTWGLVITCTDVHIEDTKYETGVGYRIELCPGVYYVYAQFPGNDYKAYYNEYVACDFSAACSFHPIAVKVNTDETVTGVDPSDWYSTEPRQW